MKIVEYKTLFANSLTEVDSEVSIYIAKNWQPWGDLKFTISNQTYIYIQVMVKYEGD